MQFFACEKCGNIITFVKDAGAPVSCCGKPMRQMEAGVVEASAEKHLPVVEVKGRDVYVCVGKAEHPSAEEHFIEWVALESKEGCQLKKLQPGKPPRVCFGLSEGDAVKAVYAYCNLHGLWKV